VRGAPLCMSSYKWLFHSCRYPVIPSDTARKFDPATHNHVVFIRNNRFFEVPLSYTDGAEVSAADLEACVPCSPCSRLQLSVTRRQITQIIDLAGSELGPAIGALTSDNRDKWTQVSLFCSFRANGHSGLTPT
jgi:carnitine O-acetyltransferase